MRPNQVSLYSKSFCSSLLLLWTHKEFVKAFCILFVPKNKPQVLWCSSASPVAQLAWSAETTAQRQALAGSAWSLQQGAAETAPGRKHLRAAGGSGQRLQELGGWDSGGLLPPHGCVGWKMVRAGGKWQSSEVLSCVYEGLNICAVGSRAALDVRGGLQAMDVCQVIHCCCLRVGDFKRYFQRKEISGQIMTWQWLPMKL